MEKCLFPKFQFLGDSIEMAKRYLETQKWFTPTHFSVLLKRCSRTKIDWMSKAMTAITFSLDENDIITQVSITILIDRTSHNYHYNALIIDEEYLNISLIFNRVWNQNQILYVFLLPASTLCWHLPSNISRPYVKNLLENSESFLTIFCFYNISFSIQQ